MKAGTETGGPAFPCAHEGGQKGMTLRDWFAGQALAGFAQVMTDPDPVNLNYVASWAYRMADAMLDRRKP